MTIAEIWQFVGPLLAAGAAYGAVKADLRRLRADVDRVDVGLKDHVNFHLTKG